MHVYDVLIGALQAAKEKAESEHGSMAPTLVVWCVAFGLLATGWTL